MALVYLVTNNVNGHKYVGYTSKSFAARKRQHIDKAKAREPEMLISRAIKKHGVEKFDFKILQDNLSIDDACQLETELIYQLKPEYNVAPGGKSPGNSVRLLLEQERGHTRPRKSVICLNDGIVYRSAIEAANAYGVSRQNVARSCRSSHFLCGGRHFSYCSGALSDAERQRRLAEIEQRKKLSLAKRIKLRPVICLTDGKRYPSAIDAARAYGLARTTLPALCETGRQKNGLRFYYEDQGRPVEIDPELKRMQANKQRRIAMLASKAGWRPVVCLETGVVYESVVEAERQIIGHQTGAILSAIQRKGMCRGKTFAYYDPKLSEKDKQRLLRLAQVAHRNNKRSVVCLNDNTTHPSLLVAADAYKISTTRVCQCCKTGVSTKSGLRFAYADAA